MSSLVESRHDIDANSDCSTRSSTISGGGRHGRMSRPDTVDVPGPASSAACRVGASSSAVKMEDFSDAAIQQTSSLFFNDSSLLTRLSLKPDFAAEHSAIDETPTRSNGDVSSPDDELQTGSSDTGSRNMPAVGENLTGEVRSRSVDTASNGVEVGCVDDRRRSPDDCYSPPGGAVDVTTAEEPPGNCDGIETSERTVNMRCQSHGAQRCNGLQTNNDYSATGQNVTIKPESTKVRNMDKSSYLSQYGWADVKLETYVDELKMNGSEDNLDSASSSHCRPFTMPASEESRNHDVISTYSGAQHKSSDDTGNSDVKVEPGARFDRSEFVVSQRNNFVCFISGEIKIVISDIFCGL